MRLIKSAVILSCSLAVCFALAIPLISLGQAEINGKNQPDKSQSAENNKPESHKGNVIGYLQSRDKVITIMSGAKGTIYTIKTKDGKTLAANIDEKELEKKYPVLFNKVKYGLAGNDATLHRSMDSPPSEQAPRYLLHKIGP